MASCGFEKLKVYQLSERLADDIWDLVLKWSRLAQDTVGKQLIRSSDSIGANIAEGSGKGTYADNRRYVRMAAARSTKHGTGYDEPFGESSWRRKKSIDYEC